jgi:hypothetical protein
MDQIEEVGGAIRLDLGCLCREDSNRFEIVDSGLEHDHGGGFVGEDGIGAEEDLRARSAPCTGVDGEKSVGGKRGPGGGTGIAEKKDMGCARVAEVARRDDNRLQTDGEFASVEIPGSSDEGCGETHQGDEDQHQNCEKERAVSGGRGRGCGRGHHLTGLSGAGLYFDMNGRSRKRKLSPPTGMESRLPSGWYACGTSPPMVNGCCQR